MVHMEMLISAAVTSKDSVMVREGQPGFPVGAHIFMTPNTHVDFVR